VFDIVAAPSTEPAASLVLVSVQNASGEMSVYSASEAPSGEGGDGGASAASKEGSSANIVSGSEKKVMPTSPIIIQQCSAVQDFCLLHMILHQLVP
jgi:hypothetical protein